MTQPSRTLKYMMGLCCAKYILSSKWLIESASAGYFLPEDDFEIREFYFEGLKMDVSHVMKSTIRNKVFEGKTFYLTPSIRPPAAQLKILIELCGGKVENNRRSILKIQEANNFSEDSYVIISCPEDTHLFNFKQFVCNIVSTEYIMEGITSQTLDIKSHLVKLGKN